MKDVVVSSAGETQPFSSAIFNLNAQSRETERSDRARSNGDAINERQYSGDQINLINLHDFSNAATDTIMSCHVADVLLLVVVCNRLCCLFVSNVTS